MATTNTVKTVKTGGGNTLSETGPATETVLYAAPEELSDDLTDAVPRVGAPLARVRVDDLDVDDDDDDVDEDGDDDNLQRIGEIDPVVGIEPGIRKLLPMYRAREREVVAVDLRRGTQ